MKIHQLAVLIEACDPEDEVLIETDDGIGDLTGFSYNANSGEVVFYTETWEPEDELLDDARIPFDLPHQDGTPVREELDEEGVVVREA
jgi:hypothetical protein